MNLICETRIYLQVSLTAGVFAEKLFVTLSKKNLQLRTLVVSPKQTLYIMFVDHSYREKVVWLFAVPSIGSYL